MSDWFNIKKAAQVAAFFCDKEGGVINVLKLVKLIYLSDRKFLSECGYSITNDRHVSMEHGPVNSLTYNLIGGNTESEDWSYLIADRAGHTVGLSRAISDDDTDELSDAEVEILNIVWADFGGMDRFAIRDWAHDNCPEWEDPDGSSTPIPTERTLRFLGVPNAEQFAKRSEAYREFRLAIHELQEDFADKTW